jgi:inhibitor of KinA
VTLPPAIYIESESSVILQFSDELTPFVSATIAAWKEHVERKPFTGFLEAVPAFLTLTIHFNPFDIARQGGISPAEQVKGWLAEQSVGVSPVASNGTPIIEIPVRYGGNFGPDLRRVAQNTGHSIEEVIALHTQALYTVAFIGFAPGFPYLSGLPGALSVPRLSTPRTGVAAGSVAIANTLTCIYPQTSPGGWNIIGHTDFVLFNAASMPPTRLAPGVQVRFCAVSE